MKRIENNLDWMKKIAFLFVLFAGILVSCDTVPEPGPDDDPDNGKTQAPATTIAVNEFIELVMNDVYYWYATVPDIDIRYEFDSKAYFEKLKNDEVAALCDVDENLFAERVKKHFTDKNLREPKLYNDMRRLFEDKSIDAVSVVTPNHWHALAGIWAIQAGKHVSIEKPSCHTIREGQMLVEAAKRYKVVVQDGAEQRSNPSAQSAVQYMRDGKLGEVYMG